MLNPYILRVAYLAIGAGFSIFSSSAPVATTLTVAVTGRVFDDRNANGRQDAGEPGLGAVAVSDQDQVVVTASDGSYRLTSGNRTGVIFVSVPATYRAAAFWSPIPAGGGSVDFALRRSTEPDELTFVHASDTHISAASRARTQRLRALVDSIRPAFVIITGDLVRDALRVNEKEATGYYTMLQEELSQLTVPVWTVPGNHENFGIERQKSGVDASHPLYGRAMYRHFRGPDYYSFNAGGVHFVGLNSVDIDDMWYYGHVDSAQVAWLVRDLATVAPQTPVVTFNHIPFFTAVETINGYMDTPPAPSVITVGGKSAFRHSVSNAKEILARVSGHPYPLALGGHMHVREALRYAGVETRFDQAAAVVGPSGDDAITFPSGISVYRVRKGRIGEATFVPLGMDSARVVH
jgi:predicted MPP superfamily phosphohydrolase